MHTTINKHTPKKWEHIVNDDGMAWTTDMPDCPIEELGKKKYKASIPDRRLNHCSFESFGWHHAWADTIEELVEDIKSFDVPFYSEDTFLNQLINNDANDKTDDRQVKLHWDGRGTTIVRGEYNINNMTAYTSF